MDAAISDLSLFHKNLVVTLAVGSAIGRSNTEVHCLAAERLMPIVEAIAEITYTMIDEGETISTSGSVQQRKLFKTPWGYIKPAIQPIPHLAP